MLHTDSFIYQILSLNLAAESVVKQHSSRTRTQGTSGQKKLGKGKGLPRTDHEGPEWE
jgi:hypothetical protein